MVFGRVKSLECSHIGKFSLLYLSLFNILIFLLRDDVLLAIDGVSQASYRGFKTVQEAQYWLDAPRRVFGANLEMHSATSVDVSQLSGKFIPYSPGQFPSTNPSSPSSPNLTSPNSTPFVHHPAPTTPSSIRMARVPEDPFLVDSSTSLGNDPWDGMSRDFLKSLVSQLSPLKQNEMSQSEQMGRGRGNSIQRIDNLYRSINGNASSSTTILVDGELSKNLETQFNAIGLDYDILSHFLHEFYDNEARSIIQSILGDGLPFSLSMERLLITGMPIADAFFILLLDKLSDFSE
jgi:hypothetical protein